jgi:hypothetical protein
MQNKDLPLGARTFCVGEKIKSDFEKFITFNTNYSNNPLFKAQITLCIQKIEKLISAIRNVNLS